jgi:hypothetical protein
MRKAAFEGIWRGRYFGWDISTIRGISGNISAGEHISYLHAGCRDAIAVK